MRRRFRRDHPYDTRTAEERERSRQMTPEQVFQQREAVRARLKNEQDRMRRREDVQRGRPREWLDRDQEGL